MPSTFLPAVLLGKAQNYVTAVHSEGASENARAAAQQSLLVQTIHAPKIAYCCDHSNIHLKGKRAHESDYKPRAKKQGVNITLDFDHNRI